MLSKIGIDLDIQQLEQAVVTDNYRSNKFEAYVTGWTASGQGFANPCQGQGDDPVPNNDPGYIVGHFVKYIGNVSTGSGGTSCDLSAFGSCVAVMTR